MIVLQRCQYYPESKSTELSSADDEARGASADLGSFSPAVFHLSGRNLHGKEIHWILTDRNLRSLSFPGQKVVVSSELIDGFVIASNSPDAFTLWLRSSFPIPTRVWSPEDRKNRSSADTRDSSIARKLTTLQDMELGSVFGAFPLQLVTAAVRQLGYHVHECTWDEWIASRPHTKHSRKRERD